MMGGKEGFRDKKVRLFKSMSFYPEWEKEFKRTRKKNVFDFIQTTTADALIYNAFDIKTSEKGEVYWKVRNEVWETLVEMTRDSSKINHKSSFKQAKEDRAAVSINEEMKKGYHESKAKLHHTSSISGGRFGHWEVNRDPYFTS